MSKSLHSYINAVASYDSAESTPVGTLSSGSRVTSDKYIPTQPPTKDTPTKSSSLLEKLRSFFTINLK